MFKIKIAILFSWTLFVSNPLYGASNDTFTHVQICKAALSSIMGVDISAIQTEKQKKGVVHLHYRIEGEHDSYDYKCKLEGNRIIWGSLQGRWRTKKADAVITYIVNNGNVTIREHFNDEPSSQVSKTTFPLYKL